MLPFSCLVLAGNITIDASIKKIAMKLIAVAVTEKSKSTLTKNHILSFAKALLKKTSLHYDVYFSSVVVDDSKQ
ncbi:hypothetical protein MBANPS3_012376 [Mucor bainieri]